MYLLDTNHCSYIINNNQTVIEALKSRATSEIGISIITCGELLYMSEKSEQKAQNIRVYRIRHANVLRDTKEEIQCALYSLNF